MERRSNGLDLEHTGSVPALPSEHLNVPQKLSGRIIRSPDLVIDSNSPLP